MKKVEKTGQSKLDEVNVYNDRLINIHVAFLI